MHQHNVDTYKITSSKQFPFLLFAILSAILWLYVVNLVFEIEVYIHLLLSKRVINNDEMMHITRVDMTYVIPIDHNRNRRLTEGKQQLASSTYSDSNISLLYNNNKEEGHSNNNNYGGTIVRSVYI